MFPVPNWVTKYCLMIIDVYSGGPGNGDCGSGAEILTVMLTE